MAGRKKHMERSHRSHRNHADMRSFGLYRMATVLNRRAGMRNVRNHQRKGDA